MSFKIDWKQIMMVMVLIAVLIGIMMFTKANESEFYEVQKPNEEEVALENFDDELNLEQGKEKSQIQESKLPEKQKAIVYICGAVKSPIVVELTTENRLNDAVKEAGGLTDNANYEGVNLAMKLTDGAQYIIPEKGKQLVVNYGDGKGNPENSQKESSNVDGKININIADQKQLQELAGIGDVLSKRIIDYREEHNGFKSVDELKQVEGIGDKKFEDIKDMVIV